MEELPLFFDASSGKAFESLLKTKRALNFDQDLKTLGFLPLGILGESFQGEKSYTLHYSHPRHSAIGATLLLKEGLQNEEVYFTSDFENCGVVMTGTGTANWFEDPRYFHCGLLGLPLKQVLQVHHKMIELYQKRFETTPQALLEMKAVLERNTYFFKENLHLLLEEKHRAYIKQNRKKWSIAYFPLSMLLMLGLTVSFSQLSYQSGKSGFQGALLGFIVWFLVDFSVKKTSPFWMKALLKRRCRQRYQQLIRKDIQK
jgi:hypothetical protein